MMEYLVSLQIFVLVVSFLTNAEGIECPNGWVARDSSCYLFVDQLEDWATSSSFCEALGAHLVTVENDPENHFLQTTIQHLHGSTNKNVFYWMGGTDVATESEWVWSKTEKPITYSNWCPGQPDDAYGQDCLELAGFCSFGWDDGGCEAKGRFICEISSVPTAEPVVIG